MKRAKNDGRKLNNSGFSLVEFLIAVAILGVVSLTIYSFMNTGARFYQRTSADADIQSEAQLVANTISDLIIDCEVNISYDTEISPGPGGGAPIHANGRILEISNSNYQFLIFHRDNNLFYLERRPNPTNPSQYEAYNIDNAELLAQNITEFEVDLSRVSGKGKGKNIVTFVMTYEKGGRSYRGNYQVNLRNAVTISANDITPTTDQENLTKIMITPSPVYIEVKGKTYPHLVCSNSCTDHVHCPAGQATKEFTANSDARNVGRTDIFNWRIEDANGPVTTYVHPVGSTTEKKFIIEFGNDLTNIPSNFKVIAVSTIRNQATGTFATGEAIVYFKKILNLNITPTRGVTNDLMDPESSAIFTANFSDYNLQPENKRCTWKLEYKVGTGGEWATCSSSAIATGRSYGGTYSVQLGSDADENYSFRLTATSEWDGTWSAEYIFGVKEKPTTPGVNAPSRGVEIDLSAYFKTPAGSEGWVKGMKNPYDDDMEIYWIDQFHSNDYDAGSDLFKLIKKDGNYYVYLDYGAYTHSTRPWEFYSSKEEQIQMVVYARSKNDLLYPSWDGSVPWSGPVPSPAWNGISTVGWHPVRNVNGSSNYYRQNVHWQLSEVEFLAGDYADRDIVIPKGGTYDVATKLIGYNITKKNLIGIYLGGMNVNAYEVGMMDANPYLSIEYTGGLGNRYVLIEDVKYRLTSKNTDTYPTAPIKIKTTLEPYYNMKDLSGAPTEKIERNASFNYNVYIANVEGTGAYIQGPPSMSDLSQWKVDGKTVPDLTGDNKYTVDITTPTRATVTFDAYERDKKISYFTMEYNGNTYYWNSTYNFWKRIS